MKRETQIKWLFNGVGSKVHVANYTDFWLSFFKEKLGWLSIEENGDIYTIKYTSHEDHHQSSYGRSGMIIPLSIRINKETGAVTAASFESEALESNADSDLFWETKDKEYLSEAIEELDKILNQAINHQKSEGRLKLVAA